MKKTNALWLIVIFASFCIAGCASMSKSVPYSFAEEGSGTAIITFSSGISLLDFEGNPIPGPARGTRWEPMEFPAGRQFLIKVNVVAKASTFEAGGNGWAALLAFVLSMETLRGVVNRNVYFVCPPLEAGKEYVLYFNSRTIRRDSIELREKGTGRILILRGAKVHEQII
jgi:hypothetical protein